MRKYRKLLIFLLTAVLLVGAVPAALASDDDWRTEERLVTVNADRGVTITFVFRGEQDYGRTEPSVRVRRVEDHTLFSGNRDLVEILDIILDSNVGTRGATVTITRDRRLYVYNAQRRLVGTTDDVHYFSSRFFLASSQIDLGGPATVQPTTPTAVIPANVTPSNAQAMVEQAVRAAEPGTTPSVRLTHPGDVSLAFMREVVSAAQGRSIAINADSFTGPANNTVDVRIRLDPSLVTTDLNLSASTVSPAAVATRNLFQRHFNRTVSVVSFGQQGDFGMEVQVAARIEVPADFNLNNFYFYSFDRPSNIFRRITPTGLAVDSNGYLHFTTSAAGDIIIATGALQRQ